MNSPNGFLGVNWGDDAADAAARLGLSCEHWRAWEGGQGFEACFDIDHLVTVFERPALIRVFRSQDRLEGISLRFRECGEMRSELADAVRREFGLAGQSNSVYTVFSDAGVVHLDYDSSDDTCTLTITGPKLGRAFAAYQLRKGFAELSSGLRPH